MKLFDNEIYDLHGPAPHNINTYDYYNKSSRPDVSEIRNTMETWFINYPSGEQADLKSQFQANFSSAYFELFLHQLFTNLGYQLTPHPIITGTRKKPDFLAINAEASFYLEAKEATDKSDSERSQEKKLGTLYNSLNEMPSRNFFIRINKVVLKNNEQPAGKKISQHFQTLLTSMDPDVVSRQLNEKGLDGIPKLVYEDDRIFIQISPIPKSVEGRLKTNQRTIGMYSGDVQFMKNDITIKDAIRNKAGRYGKLDLPYIVCINATGTIGIDDFEVDNALLGSLAIEYNIDAPTPDERWIRKKDGFFYGSKGPEYTRVSAVFITNVNPANYKNAEYRLFLHPFAARPLPKEKLGLCVKFIQGNQIQIHKGKTIAEVFNK